MLSPHLLDLLRTWWRAARRKARLRNNLIGRF